MFDFKKKDQGEMKMSPMEQSAKMNVLGGMSDDSEKDMLGKLQGLKGSTPEATAVKVEIAQPDPVDQLCEGKSPEELQEFIDRLTEKKNLLEQEAPAQTDESEKIEL